MDARQAKIARQFRLTAEEVTALYAAGLDTPHKIRDAKPEELPEGLADKLKRRGAPEEAAAPLTVKRARAKKNAEY